MRQRKRKKHCFFAHVIANVDGRRAALRGDAGRDFGSIRRDDRSAAAVAFRATAKAKKRKCFTTFLPAGAADKQAGESGRAYVTSLRLLPVPRDWSVDSARRARQSGPSRYLVERPRGKEKETPATIRRPRVNVLVCACICVPRCWLYKEV